jgi:hypothetical protein
MNRIYAASHSAWDGLKSLVGRKPAKRTKSGPCKEAAEVRQTATQYKRAA